MNTIEQLEALNWTPYNDPLTDAESSYEFWVRSEGRKLFAIHCHIYSAEPYMSGLHPVYEVQLTRSNGQVFNVELLSGSSEEAVEFFAGIYNNMNCQPYD